MPFLSQLKGENDRRKYFMINLQERMLLDPAGSNPGPPDHQSNMHLTEPLRPAVEKHALSEAMMKEFISNIQV